MDRATPLELVKVAAGHLAKKGIEGARLDAELLLAHALGVARIQLYLQFEKPLEASEVDVYREFVRRRSRREPVAYITGEREFWSLPLRVDPRVLIPRPETELLVEAALARGAPAGDGLRFLDVGTGSGAVTLALLSERPGWTAVGIDASPGALAVAADNADRLALSHRVAWRCGDFFAPVAGERFSLVVSNPPYVPTGDLAGLSPDVVRYEPRQALDGGADGLTFVRRLADEGARVVESGGWLAFEFGAGQERDVESLLGASGAWNEVAMLKDYAGLPRAAVARRT